MSEPDSIILDVVSDVMCPWCYIGKRRLDRALVLAPQVETEVRWRPFQLDATIPPEGMDRQEYLDRKFGRDQAREIYQKIREAGDVEGIPFAFDRIEKSPNTLDAHRLIRWAKTGEEQDAVVERLFELFFVEGEDIGQHGVLVEVAREAGMDTDLVAEFLATDADKDKVEKEIALAQELGIQGVPTFIIANKYVLVGAQPAELLAETLSEIALLGPGGDEEDLGAL